MELADVLILDPNPNIRWAILVDLTKFAEDQPEKLWPLIIKWGSVYNPDIRLGIACCLLEHLLGCHFREFFKRSRQEILGGNRRFAATLNYCHKLGQAEEAANTRIFDDFLASLHLRQWR